MILTEAKTFTKNDIEQFLETHNIKNYTINKNLSVDVDDDVELKQGQNIGVLPFKFGTVHGDFSCWQTSLKSLKNCPTRVEGNFNCSDNLITSFRYCPDYVGDSFWSYRNKKISKIDFLPNHIERLLDIEFTAITSLHEIQTKLKGATKIAATGIKSDVLGLLLVETLKEIDVGNPTVDKILRKYLLKKDRDVFAAQEELIDAGFGEYARV